MEHGKRSRELDAGKPPLVFVVNDALSPFDALVGLVLTKNKKTQFGARRAKHFFRTSLLQSPVEYGRFNV